MQTPLAQRVHSSFLWNSSSVFASHSIWIARSIVVARLLAPEDFGLWGMALTVIAAGTALTNIGFESSIILKKFSNDEEQTRYLNTVWTAGLLRSLGLTAALLLAAGPVARFYRADVLGALTVLSFLPLISGFQNVGLVLLRKEITFRTNAWFEQANNVMATAISIGLALWLRDVRALVWGQVLGTATSVLLSYFFHPFRPQFSLDRKSFGEAFTFGKFIFVIGLLTYVTTMADNIVVGKYVGAAALGTYVLAYNFTNLSVGIVSTTLNDVSLPAYAELHANSPERLHPAFLKMFSVGAVLLTIINVPLLILADEIVLLLFGARWLAAAPILRVLALLGFFRGYLQIVAPLIISIRGPAPEMKAKIFESIIFLAILIPLTLRYGVVGAAWAGVIVYLVTVMIRFWLIRRVAPQIFTRCIQVFGLTLFAGTVGSIAGILLMTLSANDLVRLVSGGSMALVVIVGTMWFMMPGTARLMLSAINPVRK